MQRGRMLIIQLTLVTLLLALPLAGASQPTSTPQVMGESNLTLLVYPDGSVKPVYNATLMVKANTSAIAGTSIKLVYHSRLEEGHAESKLEAEGVLASKSREGYKPSRISMVFSLKYGEGHGQVMLDVSGASEGKPFTVRLERTTITGGLKEGYTVTGYLVVQPASKEQVKPLPTPEEVNTALQHQGIDYIRVLSLNKTVEGGKLIVGFTVYINASRLLEKSVETAGPEKAEEVRKLLSSPPEVKALEASFSLEASSKPSGIQFSFSYTSRMEGNVTGYLEFSRELNSILSEASTAVTGRGGIPVPAGQKLPSQILLLLALQKLASNPASGKLVAKPPSESRMLFSLNATHTGVAVKASYEGHKLTIPGRVGDPAEAAEKTLTILSLALSHYRDMLKTLSQLVPGLYKLLPAKVALKPAASSVQLSAAEVEIDQLPTVSVAVKQPPTATAGRGAAGATATAQPSAPNTTTTTTTVKAGGGAATSTLVLAVAAATLAAVALLLALVLRARR